MLASIEPNVQSGDAAGRVVSAPLDVKREPGWLLGAALGIGSAIAVTLAADLILPARDATNYLILYLIGVVLLASRFGWRTSVCAAVASALASDFLLVPPYFSFAVARPQDVVTLAVFVWAALIVSYLTTGLRKASQNALARERRLRSLYDFLHRLSQATDLQQVAQTTMQTFSANRYWSGKLLVRDAQAHTWTDPLDSSPIGGADSRTDAGDLEEELASAGAEPIVKDNRVLVPIANGAAMLGALVIQTSKVDRTQFQPDAEPRNWLMAAAALLAQTLERLHFLRAAQEAQVRTQTEVARNSMLSAIAHDFRTPLASITAASSTLASDGDRLTPEQRNTLLQAIVLESERMRHIADSTLEMARLGAGPLQLDRDWYPAEEVVGAVLSRMAAQLGSRPVQTRLPPGLALLHLDEALIVRVLENLLGNAIKYTPDGTAIEIVIEQSDRQARIDVVDHGPGLAPGEETAIFERFRRGRSALGVTGAGLGLAICRLIVEAHGGTIWAENRPEGGARFSFSIATDELPPELPAT